MKAGTAVTNHEISTTTFFVGKDGRIRNVVVGYIDKDDFELEVQKLL